MSTILFVAIALGFAEPEQPVTEAEKTEFFKVLSKLPARGEFFTEEAVVKAIPYTRVLLALNENDLEKRGLYPFLALSRGLVDQKESRKYALANFSKIAHPTIKLAWAAMLVRGDEPNAEVVAFLRKSLDSKKDARVFSEMQGSGFQEFKEHVIRIDEERKTTRVVLVKTHDIKGIPSFGDGASYTSDSLVFAPGGKLYAVRPHKQRGELNVYDLATRKTSRLTISQPEGFIPKFDFSSYFENPVLSVSAHGTLLCRWTIEGNGDHGLARLKKGSDVFLVKRISESLADCVALAGADGEWFLIRDFTVCRISDKLELASLGKFTPSGHHRIDILAARFLSGNVLHLFWGDVLGGGNHLRMRCADFDMKEKKWLHARQIFRLDRFVSSANRPTVLQLPDDSLHYLWRVDEGANKGEASGLYYQSEIDGKTVKIASSYHYRAISAGRNIVVCYTRDDAPEKVFFRVIRHGIVGPPTAITVAREREHNLSAEHMILHSEGERLWFVNAQKQNTLFELTFKVTRKP